MHIGVFSVGEYFKYKYFKYVFKIQWVYFVFVFEILSKLSILYLYLKYIFHKYLYFTAQRNTKYFVSESLHTGTLNSGNYFL